MQETITWWHRYDSPMGPLCAAATLAGLTDIAIGEADAVFVKALRGRTGARVVEDAKPFTRLFSDFDRYFAGKPVSFNVALAPSGTPFELAVWDELRRIPWGSTLTYGHLAARIGRPRAARAIGGACGANPVPLVVPCHRVIRSDGALGGYSTAAGVEFKMALLTLEGVTC